MSYRHSTTPTQLPNQAPKRVCTRCGPRSGRIAIKVIAGTTTDEMRAAGKLAPAEHLCASCLGHHERSAKVAAEAKASSK